ncbi:MAG TPA: MerR family transcriptional regulator, partial [Burkholderiales bacterium]
QRQRPQIRSRKALFVLVKVLIICYNMPIFNICQSFVLDKKVDSMNISAVERDTGLTKDTLRMWERRYAFPHPNRDQHGERVYPPGQVEKLRMIKRLMDQGHRPGKIIQQSMEDLQALGSKGSRETPNEDELAVYVQLIRSHNVLELRSRLSQTLARVGLQAFVVETVAPLNTVVGNAWMSGQIAVYEEHMYSELIQNLLRSAIASIQPQGHLPIVLLTSLPQEQHGIGLLMAEAMLAIEGARCISLGTQTPLADIVAAARVHHADVVALSFSSAYGETKAIEGLKQLRSALPATIHIWAGGTGVARMRKPPEGIQPVTDFAQLSELVGQWRVRLAP